MTTEHVGVDSSVANRDAYAELVCAYVDEQDERILVQIAELGHELVAARTPTEVIGELHHHALAELARSHPELTLGQAQELVTDPLMELLMAYGLNFRGRLASTEQALHQKVEELARANLAKRQFLANMSHEIRTPLNGVLGMTWLLMDSPLEGEQLELVRILQESGQSLLEIIEGVLDYSKIEANQLRLEQRPLDLRACLESALETVSHRAHRKGLVLGYVLAPEVPAMIVGDVTRLRQILLNLLSNAIKFSERGEVVVTARVAPEARPSGDTVELRWEVQDAGIGIAPERQAAVFETYQQAALKNTRAYGGTGLGLAISKRLVELMGGQIAVASEVGHGARFQFSIRCRTVAQAGHACMSDRQPELTGRALLVVTRQPVYRRALTSWSQRWHMRVHCAEDGQEALQLLAQRGPFHAAIVDERAAGAERFLSAMDASAPPVIGLRAVGRTAAWQGESQSLRAPISMASLHEALVALRPTSPGLARPAPVASVTGDRVAPHRALRILMVDDNPINRKLAVAMLQRLGFAADTAVDGEDALRALRREPYDLVFMDVQMPKMNGIEATRRIRADWPPSRQPMIIALTANVELEDRQLFQESGMDGFLGKPIRVAELQLFLQRATLTLRSA